MISASCWLIKKKSIRMQHGANMNVKSINLTALNLAAVDLS